MIDKSMNMMEDNQFHCGGLNQTQLKMISLLMAIGGGLGTVVTTVILVGLILAKAYKTVLQRFFIWTVISVFIHLLVHSSSIEEYFSYNSALQDKVCSALGFVHNLIGWCEYVFYTDMIVYLLLIVHIQIRGSAYGFTQEKWVRVTLECCVVLGSVLIPLSIVWVPYYQHYYGYTYGFCWLKAFNKNCHEVSWKYKLIYGFSALEIAGLVAICICIGIVIFYCTLPVRIRRAKQIILRILVLLSAVILNFLLLNFIVVIEATVWGGYHLKMAYTLIATLTDCSFMFGYLLAFYKCSAFRLRGISQGIQRNNSMRYRTFVRSEVVTRPSSTFFEAEYTGNFTSISD